MIRVLKNIKVYDLETLTQEDLNKLALERNTLAKENDRLSNIINELENYLKEKQTLCGINQQGFSWGVAGDCLKKLQELKEGKR